ncbi:MAG TPA: DUF305 domain-containing protein [Mycobacterium sp.]|nr:DUF305 domain-containing protein [Mycobacterium sp.]
MRSARSALVAAFAALLTVGVLTACGSSDHHAAPSTSDQSTEQSHNANDFAFAHSMVPHHEQAIEMAQMVPTNTKNQKMVLIANRIIATEAPEIQALRVWLMQWPDTQGNNPFSQSAPGTVDPATMNRLHSLSDDAFDHLWLTTMIAHHKGAIAMAQDEVAHGKNADVIYLAKTIITEQQADIDAMNHMLGG